MHQPKLRISHDIQNQIEFCRFSKLVAFVILYTLVVALVASCLTSDTIEDNRQSLDYNRPHPYETKKTTKYELDDRDIFQGNKQSDSGRQEQEMTIVPTTLDNPNQLQNQPIPAASRSFEAAFQGECGSTSRNRLEFEPNGSEALERDPDGRKNNTGSSIGHDDNRAASSSNPCEHLCLDLHDGTYECSCFHGFTLAIDGYSCTRQQPQPPPLPQLQQAAGANNNNNNNNDNHNENETADDNGHYSSSNNNNGNRSKNKQDKGKEKNANNDIGIVLEARGHLGLAYDNAAHKQAASLSVLAQPEVALFRSQSGQLDTNNGGDKTGLGRAKEIGHSSPSPISGLSQQSMKTDGDNNHNDDDDDGSNQDSSHAHMHLDGETNSKSPIELHQSQMELVTRLQQPEPEPGNSRISDGQSEGRFIPFSGQVANSVKVAHANLHIAASSNSGVGAPTAIGASSEIIGESDKRLAGSSHLDDGSMDLSGVEPNRKRVSYELIAKKRRSSGHRPEVEGRSRNSIHPAINDIDDHDDDDDDDDEEGQDDYDEDDEELDVSEDEEDDEDEDDESNSSETNDWPNWQDVLIKGQTGRGAKVGVASDKRKWAVGKRRGSSSRSKNSNSIREYSSPRLVDHDDDEQENGEPAIKSKDWRGSYSGEVKVRVPNELTRIKLAEEGTGISTNGPVNLDGPNYKPREPHENSLLAAGVLVEAEKENESARATSRQDRKRWSSRSKKLHLLAATQQTRQHPLSHLFRSGL